MFNDKRGFTLAEGATHVGTFNNKRKFGFTLAEVLITLGIIGVVAVLTVPNLVSNYQKKVYVAQLQKAYNQISNAVSLLMVDEEVHNLNDTYLYCEDSQQNLECIQRCGLFLKKYFKVSKDCGVDYESRECLSAVYKKLNKEDAELSYNEIYGYVVSLNSGATIAMLPFTYYVPSIFLIDVNGKKAPNTYGRDVFQITVNFAGDIAETFQNYPNHTEMWSNDPERCLENEVYNSGCFSKIINDGWKMDY